MLDLFAALDVDDKEKAFSLVESLKPHIKGFKVGPRLGFLLNENEWKLLADAGEVFIDYKFYDIPSTVLSAVKRSFNLGASYCTVHAANGALCLEELSALEKELNSIKPFKILVVSLLTSFDQDKNKLPLSGDKTSDELVFKLIDLAYSAGMRNFVCSPYEAKALKEKYRDIFLVTPGVRLNSGAVHDQSRVATPEFAWKNGADYLVTGRMLTESSNLINTINTVKEQWQIVKKG